jgi:hypothetical protein
LSISICSVLSGEASLNVGEVHNYSWSYWSHSILPASLHWGGGDLIMTFAFSSERTLVTLHVHYANQLNLYCSNISLFMWGLQFHTNLNWKEMETSFLWRNHWKTNTISQGCFYSRILWKSWNCVGSGTPT